MLLAGILAWQAIGQGSAAAPAGQVRFSGQATVRAARPTAVYRLEGEPRRAPRGPAQAVPGEVIVRFRPVRGFLPGIVPAEAARATAAVRQNARVEAEQAMAAVGVRVVADAVFGPSAAAPAGLFLYKVKLPDGMALDEGIRRLSALPQVEYAVPNYKRYAHAVGARRAGITPRGAAPANSLPPNDPYLLLQWGLHNVGQTIASFLRPAAPDGDIDAPEAWRYEVGDPDNPVVVAVIDEGVQVSHPELAAQMWTNPRETPGDGIDNDGNGFVDDVYGWDFLHDDASVYDSADGEIHATHVAGIVGARANDGLGLAGVIWNVKIMSLKFLGPDGGEDWGAIQALAYAKAIKERDGLRMVVNASWGGPGDSTALKEAIEASDMLFVAAAGNEGADSDQQPDYPSAFDSPNIVSVAASDVDDRLAFYSNWGPASVDLAAPGDIVLSLYPTDNPLGFGSCSDTNPCYLYMSGTSMAAPHVTGVAALVMSRFPEMSWDQVKQRILQSVDPKPELAGRLSTGGRLNARSAVAGRAPVITALSATPAVAPPGTPVRFSAAAELPGGGPVSQFRWEFGDGTSATGSEATHTYATQGGYRVVLHAGPDENKTVEEFWVVAAGPDTAILVDDDGNTPYWNVTETSLQPALQEAGIDHVRIESPLALPASMTNPVIWNTGQQFTATLTAAEQQWLERFLDQGGRLFLAGADVLWELEDRISGPAAHPFVRNYLHVGSVLQDMVGALPSADMDGVPGDPISSRMRLSMDAALTAFADVILPDGAAAGIFTDQASGFTALRHEGSSRLVFSAFPFEGIVDGPNPNNGATLLARIHSFLTSERSVNPPPVVDALRVSPGYVRPGTPVEFRASAHDPDGGAVTYEWDFGDGTRALGAAVRHTYGRMGNYAPVLRVRDDDGAVTERRAYVSVLEPGDVVLVGDFSGIVAQHLARLGVRFLPAEPLALVGGYPEGLEKYTVIGTAGEFGYFRPEHQVLVAEHLRRGGKLWASGQELLFGLTNGADGPVAPGTFARDVLRVVEVYHDVIEQTPVDVTGVEGDPITGGLVVTLDYEQPGWLNLSDSIVPDTAAGAAGILTHPVDADGRAGDDFTALRFEDPNTGARLIFTAFPIEAIPLGPEGEPAFQLMRRAYAWLTGQGDLAPSIDAAYSTGAFANPGAGVPFFAQAHDRDGGTVTYRWDFGDGMSSTEQNPTHAYAAPGAYTATLTVTDDEGRTAGPAFVRVFVNEPVTFTVDIASIEETLTPNQLVTRTIRVRNTGTGTLPFAVTKWAGLPPAQPEAAPPAQPAGEGGPAGLRGPQGQLDQVAARIGTALEGLQAHAASLSRKPLGLPPVPSPRLEMLTGDPERDAFTTSTLGSPLSLAVAEATGLRAAWVEDGAAVQLEVMLQGGPAGAMANLFLDTNRDGIPEWLLVEDPSGVAGTMIGHPGTPVAVAFDAGLALSGIYVPEAVYPLTVTSRSMVVQLPAADLELAARQVFDVSGEVVGATVQEALQRKFHSIDLLGEIAAPATPLGFWYLSSSAMVGWLDVTPVRATLAGPSEQAIQVAIRAPFQPGTYTARLRLHSPMAHWKAAYPGGFPDGWTTNVIDVPITLTVTAGAGNVPPLASFNHDPVTELTTATEIRFIDASQDDGTVSAWSWEFGDGATSTEQHPVHRYGQPGVYHVYLQVTDDAGATSDRAHAVLAVGTPGAPVQGIVTQRTAPGDETVDASDVAGVLVTKHGPGTPVVTVASLAGNPRSDARPVFGMELAYFDVNLDSSSGVDAMELRWHFPAGVLPETLDPGRLALVWFDPSSGTWQQVQPQTVVVAPANGWGGYVEVRLDATSSPSLAQLTGTIVGAGVPNQPPVASAGPDRYGAVGAPVRLNGSGSRDPDAGDSVTSYRWQLVAKPAGSGVELNRESADSEVVFVPDKPGRYEARLVVKDSFGWESSPDTVVVQVLAAYAAPNPARGSVTFHHDAGLGGGSVRIYDVAGRLVRVRPLDASGRTAWDLTDESGRPVASGLYLWLLFARDGKIVFTRPERLVVQR